MPARARNKPSRETTGGYVPQIRIHAPQPINLAALHRLRMIIELYDTPCDNGWIAASDATPQLDIVNMDLNSGTLATTNPDIPSQGVGNFHGLPGSWRRPSPSAISQDNTNMGFREGRPQIPEQVTFWPVLERHLRDPSLPRPDLRCMICPDVMLVLGLHQFVRVDVSFDYEKCVVLPCGHLIGSRCFHEYISKHSESDRDWQDEQQELWLKPLTCPICRMGLLCRRCGLSYQKACLPAFIDDELVDLSSILTGPAELPELCESCSEDLEGYIE